MQSIRCVYYLLPWLQQYYIQSLMISSRACLTTFYAQPFIATIPSKFIFAYILGCSKQRSNILLKSFIHEQRLTILFSQHVFVLVTQNTIPKFVCINISRWCDSALLLDQTHEMFCNQQDPKVNHPITQEECWNDTLKKGFGDLISFHRYWASVRSVNQSLKLSTILF